MATPSACPSGRPPVRELRRISRGSGSSTPAPSPVSASAATAPLCFTRQRASSAASSRSREARPWPSATKPMPQASLSEEFGGRVVTISVFLRSPVFFLSRSSRRSLVAAYCWVSGHKKRRPPLRSAVARLSLAIVETIAGFAGFSRDRRDDRWLFLLVVQVLSGSCPQLTVCGAPLSTTFALKRTCDLYRSC
jgi:hypothetical protein